MNQRVASFRKESSSKTGRENRSWGFELQLNAKQRLLAIAFAIVLLLSFLFSLVIGVYPIPVKMVISGILGAELPPTESFLVWQVRLPRAIMAALVGAGLSTSGAAMQGLFQNPLADPGLIGVSSGAMLFAAIGIVALPEQITNLWPWLSPFFVAIAAFIGSVVTTIIVFRFATLNGRTSVQLMLLSGLAISALASAGTGFLSYLSNDQELRDLTLWFLGSVGST
ncbi:MAG: iron ABC transporter permease, partial [Bacteroidota bacterium]